MIKKSTIANFIFLLAVCYIISPWFFERKLFFNEIISATGFLVLLSRRFRTANDLISICMILLLTWGGVHLVSSITRQDSLYYYLRNSVIVYSMFAFFAGFYLLKYLSGFISMMRGILRYYIGIFLFIPLPLTFYERYGVSTLFPALFRNARYRFLPLLLVLMNLIYAYTYRSSTALMIALFLILIFISTGYRFFKQSILIIGLLVLVLFVYLQPNLALIKNNYSPYSTRAIKQVMRSHPLLSLDGNSTWRLVMWKEIIVDHFPVNLFGLGFGTPMLRYHPVEDYGKVASLPYVMGAHNSFIYLFGRLGLFYLLIIAIVYAHLFKEYYRYKDYYYSNNQVLIFWSFFVITVIALFNPALESPMFASEYWMLLGLTARCIYNRNTNAVKPGGTH